MMKKLVSLVIVFIISMSLTNGLLIVNAQEFMQDKPWKINDNFDKIFGEPIYKEVSRESSNSIVLNVEDGKIKTQDSYTATGFFKDIGNVTEKSTFITTYQPEGNTSTSTGRGIMITTDGEIATYIGQDIGLTDKNGTQTYRGIEIFQTDSDGKLSFLDNLVGLYEYKYWPNGTKSGSIWQWK